MNERSVTPIRGRTAAIAVPCMKVQVCDHALHGCGRIIENIYDVAQICDYTRHPGYEPRPDRPLENAPYMRCAVVAEVVAFPMNPIKDAPNA
jgi:hypothetical protein